MDRPTDRCHPNWSNDSYSKIFLRINVGQNKTSTDNCTKKEFFRICHQLPKLLKVWHLFEENLSLTIGMWLSLSENFSLIIIFHFLNLSLIEKINKVHGRVGAFDWVPYALRHFFVLNVSNKKTTVDNYTKTNGKRIFLKVLQV